MKKRNLAKIFVLVVALVMLVSILVACGEQNAPALKSAQYDSQGKLIVTLTDGTVLEPIDVNSLHTYGEWSPLGDFYPTCEEKIFYRSCAQCGDVEFKLGSYDDHDFVIETTKATCQVEGKEQRKCTICGMEEEKVLPKVDHEWERVYQFDTTYHWKKCINCTATTTKVEHVVDDSGYCTTCNGILGDTVGVIYDLSTDGTYAEVLGYEGSAKRVIIASEYNGKPVKSIYEEAFKKLAITSVVIPDSVISIGDEAFRGCALTSVTIPDSVTSIGSYAFENCTSLSSVNYLGTIEQWCGIAFGGYSANPLYYAKKLYLNGELLEEDLVIPNTVTEIKDHAFRDCTSIKSVTIPDSVTSIGNSAFYSCDSLTSVTIPDSVTSIGDEAFGGCDSLTRLTIPDSVTSIGYQAFSGCNSALYTTENSLKYVKANGNPYYLLMGATNANLSTYNINAQTKHIGYYVFDGCQRLSSITIPDSVTSIGSNAFYNCDSLSSVTIGSSVTSIGEYAFSDCDSLSSVNYLGTIEQWCGITFGSYSSNPLWYGAKLYLNGELVEDLVIPNTVTEIKAYAFRGCDSITSVTVPDSVTSIGYDAFAYCDSLTSVTIGNSVTSIGDRAFYWCDSLSTVYYNGTKEEWSDISIGGSWNYDLTGATRYYYSETEPTTSGNYWRYGDGGVPTPW